MWWTAFHLSLAAPGSWTNSLNSVHLLQPIGSEGAGFDLGPIRFEAVAYLSNDCSGGRLCKVLWKTQCASEALGAEEDNGADGSGGGGSDDGDGSTSSSDSDDGCVDNTQIASNFPR